MHCRRQKSKRTFFMTWFIWLLPVAAAALCGWFVLHDFVFAGPTITIYFQDADGLQEKNTMVKYRGINIGQVDSLKLAGQAGGMSRCARNWIIPPGILRGKGRYFGLSGPKSSWARSSGFANHSSPEIISPSNPGNGERRRIFLPARRKRPLSLLPGLLSPCWRMILARWKINRRSLIAASRWGKCDGFSPG